MTVPALRRAALSFAFMLTALWVPGRASAGYEWSAGYADPIDSKTAYTTHLTWLSPHRSPWEITGGVITGRDSSSREISPDTLYISLARRYVHSSGWYFAGGIALTSTDGNDEVLSGPFQFVNGIGWQGERIVVTFRHISNGSTRGRNRGENLLTVGWRF